MHPPLPYALAILGVTLLPTMARAQAANGDTAEVRTAASATRVVPATQGSVTLEFAAEGSTPAQAGHRLAVRADSVRRALQALGVARDSIVTGSRWYWWPDRIQTQTRPRCVLGRTDPCRQALDTVFDGRGLWHTRELVDTVYRSTEIFDVRVNPPDLMGAVIDTALALRITTVSGIRFTAADVGGAQAEALREATIRVHDQAEAIARASGGRLGRILLLSTQSEEQRPSWGGWLTVTGTLDPSNPASTIITPSGIPVTVTVYGRWQLLGP